MSLQKSYTIGKRFEFELKKKIENLVKNKEKFLSNFPAGDMEDKAEEIYSYIKSNTNSMNSSVISEHMKIFHDYSKDNIVEKPVISSIYFDPDYVSNEPVTNPQKKANRRLHLLNKYLDENLMSIIIEFYNKETLSTNSNKRKKRKSEISEELINENKITTISDLSNESYDQNNLLESIKDILEEYDEIDKRIKEISILKSNLNGELDLVPIKEMKRYFENEKNIYVDYAKQIEKLRTLYHSFKLH